MRAFLVLVALVAVGLPAPAHARSLRDVVPAATAGIGIQGSAFEELADSFADTAARSVPILAASAGYTYRYNPELEVFERTSETLGPLFLDRPNTLGRGKFNVNVSYQYVKLDQFDGNDLSKLGSPFPIIVRERDVNGDLLQSAAFAYRYDLSLVNHIAAFSLTYGILDDLDVNVLVPLISTEFDAGVTARQVATADPGQPFSPAPGPTLTGHADETKFGVGDILLRGKYQLPTVGIFQSALGLQFRLPSGDEDNFQGTGDFEASPSFYLSTVLWNRVEPHAAFAVDLRSDEVERSQGRYAVGVDVDATRRIGIALAFLGRSEFQRSSPSGATNFLHLVGNTPTPRPILNVEFDRKDFYDLSFGVRAVVWRQVMVYLNGIYALNDDGLRNSEVIPTAGVEATF